MSRKSNEERERAAMLKHPKADVREARMCTEVTTWRALGTWTRAFQGACVSGKA